MWVRRTDTKSVGDKNTVIAAHTYEALKAVDVTFAFREKDNLSSKECPRQSIPLLEEVLLLFSKYVQTKISIQPKADCVKSAVVIVKRMEMTTRVGINDGDLKYMAEVKKLARIFPFFGTGPMIPISMRILPLLNRTNSKLW
jgi:glycerophosphoryl diester phosphodiesterase